MIDQNFENADCLICHSNKSNILFSFKKFTIPLNIVKCDCSFIYLNPRPISKQISKYYCDNYLPHKNNISLSNFYRI